MKPIVPFTFAGALLATAGAAQCPFQVAAVQSHGSGCTETMFEAPHLTVQLEPTCDLRLEVLADGGCCNTYLQLTVLIVGAQPTSVPVPFLDPGCLLQVQPDAFFLHFGAVPPTFTFPLLPGMTPFTFEAQVATGYFTTLSFPAPAPLDFALSRGHTVVVQ